MKKLIAKNNLVTPEYINVLQDIKQRIQQAQIKVILSVNKELIKLYFYIGKTISIEQKTHQWGSKTIEKLAQDIQNEFPGLAGFSESNLFYMRSFYLTYEIVQQAVGLFLYQICNYLASINFLKKHLRFFIKNLRKLGGGGHKTPFKKQILTNFKICITNVGRSSIAKRFFKIAN